MKARAAERHGSAEVTDAAAHFGMTGRSRPLRRGLFAFLGLAAAIALLPVLVLAGLALTSDGSDVVRLIETVLPRAALVTFELLALVALLSGSIGVLCAWLIADFDFPGKRHFAWMLVLPIAIPTYIAAYAFVEFFHFAGPVQTALRAVTGWQSARDYWFPNIRSLSGAALILSLVLYPYVYLAARMVFMMQSRHQADVARSLGASPLRVFWKVSLPMARPAIAAGVSLALMETLNDLGAVEYLGVRTLTFSVYNTWLAQGSLSGAAQLACAMLVVVFALLGAEQFARRRQRFYGGRHGGAPDTRRGARLRGGKAAAASLACAVPVLFGFAVPAFVIGSFAARRLSQFSDPALGAALANSVMIASATAALTAPVSLVLVHAGRSIKRPSAALLIRTASIGYCMPGTVLALGLLYALAAADNRLDGLLRTLFGVSSGLLMTGSAFGVILACSIRFLTLSERSLQSGLEKISSNLDDAARNLGQTELGAARRVVLPLLSPAIMTAFLLVFIDTLKELPATLLLRPFGLSTLATHVYESASRAAVEEGSAAALCIVAAGLLPVILLSRAGPGAKKSAGETGAS
jgi:iron(III) transport system permease protein